MRINANNGLKKGLKIKVMNVSTQVNLNLPKRQQLKSILGLESNLVSRSL